jgi:hypothetical protein
MKVVIPGFEIVPTGGCDSHLYDSSCVTSLKSFQEIIPRLLFGPSRGYDQYTWLLNAESRAGLKRTISAHEV